LTRDPTIADFDRALANLADEIEQRPFGSKLIPWFDRLEKEREELLNSQANLRQRLDHARQRYKTHQEASA